MNTWNDIREVVQQLAHTVTEPLENDPALATGNRRVLPASALGSRPGGGTVLLAGAPELGFWDVQVRDSGSRLWLSHPSGTDGLPGDATDTWVADAIKVRIVQAWADRGDPEAAAVMARLHNPSQRHYPADRPHTTGPRRPVAFVSTVPFLDPLALAVQMVQTANRAGWAFLTGSPRSAAFTWSGPWGSFQSIHISR